MQNRVPVFFLFFRPGLGEARLKQDHAEAALFRRVLRRALCRAWRPFLSEYRDFGSSAHASEICAGNESRFLSSFLSCFRPSLPLICMSIFSSTYLQVPSFPSFLTFSAAINISYSSARNTFFTSCLQKVRLNYPWNPRRPRGSVFWLFGMRGLWAALLGIASGFGGVFVPSAQSSIGESRLVGRWVGRFWGQLNIQYILVGYRRRLVLVGIDDVIRNTAIRDSY